MKQYTARTYLLRTRTEEEACSDSDHVTKALVTLFLSVLIQNEEGSNAVDNDEDCDGGPPLCVLLKNEEEGDVDNDEDCDGSGHLAVSYRRQHRLLASYLEMVHTGPHWSRL